MEVRKLMNWKKGSTKKNLEKYKTSLKKVYVFTFDNSGLNPNDECMMVLEAVSHAVVFQ